MILGNIIGKSSTLNFRFLVKGNARKFDYVQIITKSYEVLAQIIEIEKEAEQTVAFCNVLGYRDKILKQLLVPLEPGIEVLKASDEFIKKTLGLEESKNGAFIGCLNGYESVNVFLDLNKLLTKHVAVLAKSGSGKSYTVAVLVEEILDKEIPLLVIDPHGEYSSLRYKNDKDNEKLEKLNVKAKSYAQNVNEYSPDIENNPSAKPLKLNAYNLSSSELVHLLPARLSNAQLGLLYSGLRNMKDKVDFSGLITELELEENNAKYTLINLIEFIQKLNLFSYHPSSLQELIQPGKCTIINLKGVQTELQEVIVYKLLKDLFYARKKSEVPPFFVILEEAHNYIPERNFGEAKSSSIIRQISSEGRKFGLGLCAISQRPSRIDKSLLSQCTTQIILKVTNPGDIKAIANSVEGLTGDTEKEIKNIPIGTAMITGIVDLPLFVNVRPRKTRHGGEAVNMIDSVIPNKSFIEETQSLKLPRETKGELLNVIMPKYSQKDIQLMSDKEIKEIKTSLVPCLFANCQEFNLLINLNNGELVNDFENGKGTFFSPKIELSPNQRRIFDAALVMKNFTSAEIFAKTGVQFSDVYDAVTALVKKGYFVQEGNKYKLAQTFNLNFEDYACYVSPDFSRISYDSKLEKNYNSDEVLRFLGNFISVKGNKECYLMSYDVEY
ncbi:ATP-binding protein [Candidatus Woesearchaeota archaeon]|nr:ATP-binding protein [Candidatus Woesearchaeota archaeon]